MAQELTPIDISTMPELARLAKEVRDTGTPRRLRHGNEDVAILSPTRPPRRRRKGAPVTQADIDAALTASWEGLTDPEHLKQELDAARSDDQLPVQL